MVWLMVGGAVCLGLVLLWGLTVAVIYISVLWEVVATEHAIEKLGTPVLAVPVVANAEVLRRQRKSAPGWVIFSHEPPSPELADAMRELAAELYELYAISDERSSKLSAPQRRLAEWLKEDKYQKGRRLALPLELTQRMVIYLADVWIGSRDLPPNLEFVRVLACRVTGTEAGDIMTIPSEEEEAKRIYAATGAYLADEAGPIRFIRQTS